MTWKEIVKVDSKLDEDSLESLRHRRENYDSDESSDKRERSRELADANKMADGLIEQLSLNLDMLKEMKKSGVDALPDAGTSKALLDFLINWDYAKRDYNAP